MQLQEIVDYLLRLSQGKAQLSKNLLILTKEQGLVLDVEETSKLEKLLSKKQEIMGKIDLLDKEFIEKYSLLKDILGVESLEEVKDGDIAGLKELQQQIGEILFLMEEIKKVDEENTKKITSSLNSIKKKIKSIKTGKKAVTGYNAQYREMPSIYIDNKK